MSERQPLRGRTVVVTRPREDAGPLAQAVEALGGKVLACPAIRIEFVEPAGLASEIGELGAYDWVVFTSANAVRSIEPLLAGGRPAAVAAIGPRTAREARRAGLAVEVVSRESTGEALASELEERIRSRQRVLLPQSDIASSDLAEALARRGADVRAVVSYRTLPAGPEESAELRALLEARVPDAVLFASPSAVRGLEGALGGASFRRLMRGAALFSIGPSTTRQLAALGFAAAGEARPPGLEGLAAALERFFAGRRG